ncbi:30S ribosomal protein S3 [Methanobacterium sp. VT]|uniref:Small ribosomal subunit protein uS3 n=1 Tax=Methanobacterium spitsbergense TaxID=2874285 RepID=A0A8T5V3I5_9EURY|nr:30S ribosomal protein S3 [Methanobacterium spitsbergense]
MIEKDFVTEGLKRTRIDEYLENELERAGYGGMEIQVTPLGTMVVVYAERPGMVIGRGGKTVRSITQNLKTGYGLENPQVEVKEVDIPELNPKIMAHKIAAMLQRGMHFRRVAYTALRRIMGAGAQGVEVTISGKIRGSRSACAKFSDGYIKKCGEPSIRFVRHGFATVQLKPGVLGINVRIMPPDVVLPDKVEILQIEIEEPVVEKTVEVEATPDKMETVESVVEEIVEEAAEESAEVDIIEEAVEELEEVSEEPETIEEAPVEKASEEPEAETTEEAPVEESSEESVEEKAKAETTEEAPVEEESEEETKPEDDDESKTQEASKTEETTEKGDKSE